MHFLPTCDFFFSLKNRFQKDNCLLKKNKSVEVLLDYLQNYLGGFPFGLLDLCKKIGNIIKLYFLEELSDTFRV
jgi:hypothetical protein